jgi:Leu/Phe-tRNA-protein transferase
LYQLKQKDIGWLDTQMVTPVVESLGGVEIPRETYLKMLAISIK